MRNECQWRVFIGLWERIDREWEMNADDVCLFVCISLFVQSVNSLFSRAGIFPVHLIWFIFEGIRFIREKKTKERMDVRKRKKVRKRESGCWQEKCNLLSWSSSVGFFWKGNDCKQTKDLQLDCCYNLLIPFPQRLSFLSLSLCHCLNIEAFFFFLFHCLNIEIMQVQSTSFMDTNQPQAPLIFLLSLSCSNSSVNYEPFFLSSNYSLQDDNKDTCLSPLIARKKGIYQSFSQIHLCQ